jgi:predicted PolB exonuclease-like 3'-5' exonuclease
LPETLTDADVLAWYNHERREATGSEFAQLPFQKVVAIACVLRHEKGLKVWSLGQPEDDERELVRRFFDGVEKLCPQLVSWNGGGFDLPVLHYRAMIHRIAAPRYWDLGEENRDFKFNNYISRYHTRHLDLMDVLAMYQPRANAGLDTMARLCGFPGKLLMDGGNVNEAIAEGKILDVRHYCETDTMNTYLLYLRFQLMRGILSEDRYQQEIGLVKEFLEKHDADYWQAFLEEFTIHNS